MGDGFFDHMMLTGEILRKCAVIQRGNNRIRCFIEKYWAGDVAQG